MAQTRPRICILGAGPAGLGAAYRLHQLGFTGFVHLFEARDDVGGSALSVRDAQGHAWDLGGSAFASHATYFDRVLQEHGFATEEDRASFHIWLDGQMVRLPQGGDASGLPASLRDACAAEWKALGTAAPGAQKTLDAWLLAAWGATLGEKFACPLMRKAWSSELSHVDGSVVFHDAAMPDGHGVLLSNPRSPAPTLRPRVGKQSSLGELWRAVAASLPPGWLQTGHEVTGIDIAERRLHVRNVALQSTTTLPFDFVISTLPLDQLMLFVGEQQLAAALRTNVLSCTRVVFHVSGKPPKALAGCTWAYFPQGDIPFFRAQILAQGEAVGSAGGWTLICETHHGLDAGLNPQALLAAATMALTKTLAWFAPDAIRQAFCALQDYAHPRPFVGRDAFLKGLFTKLEQGHGILTRGRFGAWKTEVGQPDHAFMQGVEAAEHMVNGVEETTVYHPHKVMGKVQARFCDKHDVTALRTCLGIEMVVAHYNEDLGWLGEHADHAIVYTKGGRPISFERYPRQAPLPNIGREAHTYLHHIVHNYHRLADTTLFCQGRLDDSVKRWLGVDHIMYQVLGARREVTVFRPPSFFEDWDGIAHGGKWLQELNKGIMRKSEFTPAQFWTWVFETPPPPMIVWHFGATFGVRRSAIVRRPRTFYERLLGYFEKMNHINPEEGHYMERIWLSIFGAPTGCETLLEYGRHTLTNQVDGIFLPPPGRFWIDILE